MTYKRIFKKKKKNHLSPWDWQEFNYLIPFYSKTRAVVPARDPSWTTSPSYSPTSRFIQLCQYRQLARYLDQQVISHGECTRTYSPRPSPLICWPLLCHLLLLLFSGSPPLRDATISVVFNPLPSYRTDYVAVTDVFPSSVSPVARKRDRFHPPTYPFG